MKILSIGNSFSQDAHKWLHKLAKANGIDIETVNLYIGGCSLERHYTNMTEDIADYDLEINGGEATRKISICEALALENWDVITLQQVSQNSGMPETYEPYLAALYRYVRERCPAAQIYLHQTWAYETDSTHDGFANYGCDQANMYACIVSTTEKLAASYGIPVIPVGRVIQALRETVPAFDYAKTGRSLCRDGFHLSLDYGRYAAAAVWIKTLTGRTITAGKFEDFDPQLMEQIIQTANSVCRN